MSRFTSDSKPGRSRIGPLLLALCLAGVMVSGQVQRPSPRIESVSILIDGLPGGESITELVSVRPGETYSPKRINQTIKQIYRTGLFSYIRAEKTGTDRLALVFHLTSRLFTRRIFILGGDDLPKKSLLKRLSYLREQGAYSEEKQEKTVEELQAALDRAGEFGARIRSYTERVEGTNQVDVFFQVQSSRRYTVESVTFVGDTVLEESALRKTMKTRPGAAYVPDVLEQDLERVKRLLTEEGYQRAEIRVDDPAFDEDRGRVALSLNLLPREKIELVITGADVPESLLRPIWETPIFEEWGAAEGEAKIIGYLRKKGYIYTSVQSTIERGDNLIRIIHKVAPAQRYRIGEIEFRGMRLLEDTELREELALQESIPIFRSLDGARLFEILPEIEFFYKTRGFPETQVSLNFEPQGRKVKPIINIEEGRREIISNLSVEGADLFAQDRLHQVFDSRAGGPYYQPNVQKDIEKLVNFYLDEGVRGTSIRALVENPSENEYTVTFQVEEGRPVRIAKIVITGHRITRQKTILRELMIAEGDLARWGNIRATKRRLENLGVFTEIKVEEISLGPDSENLLISLREGERHYVGLGLGLETREEPKTFAVWNNVIRPRGTAELIRSNMFGVAAQVSLVGQLSLKERRAVFSWEQPYFLGIPMPTSFNGWWEREERKSYTYERQGISLSGIRSLASDQSLALVTTLRYARTKLLTLLLEENELDRQFFPYSTTSISGTIIWDKRSDPFNPESGHFFSSVFEWAYPLINSESNFQKAFSKFQYYLSPWPRVLFSATTRLGLGRGRIPIHERFFAGGSNSFRGAKFDELGPKDPDSIMPVGGKALVLFNFELSVPILSQLPDLLGTVFYDKGGVFAQRKQVSLAGLQDALGLGLRYRTPLGPVRLELGWNLDAPEGERKTIWFITIGNVF